MNSYSKDSPNSNTNINKTPSYKGSINSNNNNINNINNVSNITNFSPNLINYNFSNIKQKINPNSQYSFHNEKQEEIQEKKLEDIKQLNIKDDLDPIFDITYNVYKKEFQKDKSFSIELSDDIMDEVNDILYEFNKKLRKREDNLTDSILSEILDDLGKLKK
jgi:hypothetical protein